MQYLLNAVFTCCFISVLQVDFTESESD